MQASCDNAQSIIKNAVNEASVRTTTPNWCTVLSNGVDQGKSRDVQCFGTCTHPDPASRLNSGTLVESFLHKTSSW